MKHSNSSAFSRSKRHGAQAGLSLLEMTIALMVLLVVAVTSMSLAGVAVGTTENQGHFQARTAEYAQDKMEQLLALNICDQSTDTTVYPAVVSASGTGLAGCSPLVNTNIPRTPFTGGGLSFSAPVAGYVDYVDANGNPTGSSANWLYMRVWQISLPPGTNFMKQITVSCRIRAGVSGQGGTPQTTIVSLKSYPF